MAIPSFVDRVKFTVAAGNGGNGCVSVLREKFRPLGGPDGGNGGDGGSIIFRVDEGLTTLLEFHRQSIRRAPNGEPGKGDMKHGARGEDMILEVPSGTIVTDLGTGEQLADLTEHGEEFVAAQGGRGGLGNAALANAQRKAPGFALLGEEGDERLVQLELKFVADVGLVGFPSAGKSSLIAAISRARPKIADYPFTTLVPNLGVVQAGDVTYTVADVPGLIEGASEGRGLGFDFLRHIDRCHALVHIIDLATYEPGRDPVGDLEIIEGELTAHGGLENRPRLIALNKVDLPDAPEMADIVRPDLERFGHPVFAISTKTGEGLNELKFAMAEIVEKRRSEIPAAEPKPVIRPTPVGRAKNVAEFEIVKKGDGEGGFVWRVTGEKPERWVKQTDFNNGEAVGFLSDRLGKIGIEAKLLDLGAQAGDAVAIGGEDPVVFDFAPQIEAGAELLSRRGDDHRLDTQRPAVTRRRVKDAEYHAAREAGVDYMVEGLPEEDDES